MNEDRLLAAQREFQAETGITPQGIFTPLGSVALKSGKIVHAWAFKGDYDPTAIKSNRISIEWPPKSGNVQAYTGGGSGGILVDCPIPNQNQPGSNRVPGSV